MKIFGLVILIFVSSLNVAAQTVNQDSIGEIFLTQILLGEYEKSWAMLEPKIKESSSIEEFISGCKTFLDLSKRDEEVTFFMDMVNMTGDGTRLYTKIYKLKSDVSKGMSGLLFHVVFLTPHDTLISGFQPRMQRALPSTGDNQAPGRVSTTQAQEEIIEGSGRWEIDGKNWEINEVVLIHFSGNQSMLAIKVYHSFESINMADAKDLGLPLVKRAIKKGLFKKAQEIATKEGKELFENIGVALIRPNEASGYRVQFTPQEYND